MLVCAALTFRVRAANLYLELLSLLLLGLAIWVARKWWTQHKEQNPAGPADTCFAVFLFTTILLNFAAGLLIGQLNLNTLRPYDTIVNMALYVDVDPSTDAGYTLLDAGRMLFNPVQGRVFFKPGTHPDIDLSSGFKSGDIYCVAPVTLGHSADHVPIMKQYDFWAVGVNCCSGVAADFHCGDVGDPRASAGLRLQDDSSRPYFRLAVQQAEAAYGIYAPHPVFLRWMRDPTAEVAESQKQATRQFVVATWTALVVQLFLVAALAAVLARLCRLP